MKFFCIFTPNDNISQSLLARCIRTGLKFGHEITPFKGVSKELAPSLFIKEKLNFGFDYLVKKKIAPMRNSQIACFLAHKALWEVCINLDKQIVILEHDAYFVKKFSNTPFDEVLNLQREIWDNPSWKYYAKLQKLVDNNNYNGNAKYLCLPGAAAYTIKPKAAKKLLMIKSIFPLDLFVNKEVVKIDDHQFMSTFKVDNDYTTNR